MHDSNLEDRLRGTLRAEADAQSLTVTTAELERRLALRRRERNGRRMTFMAAGIAVVAIGSLVAFGNGWLRMPSSGQSSPAVVAPPPTTAPSAQPTQSAAPDASPSPAPSVAASPAASEDVVPCTQLGRTGGTAVQFIAGAVPGDAMGYLASPVAWGTDTQTNGDPTAWEAPDGIATISLDTSAKLRFVGADQLYCITAVSADVRPVGTNETGVPLPAVHQAPASSIDLAPPGIGTWQIRVKVEFPTASGTTWTVETFEVDVQAPIGSPAG